MEYDMYLLKKMGIDLMDTTRYPSIIGILDTACIATRILGPGIFGSTHSLENICELLDVSSFNPHVAGNDANFALKALLLLAVKSVENRDLTLEQKSRLLRIQAVAQVPIEDNAGGKTPD